MGFRVRDRVGRPSRARLRGFGRERVRSRGRHREDPGGLDLFACPARALLNRADARREAHQL